MRCEAWREQTTGRIYPQLVVDDSRGSFGTSSVVDGEKFLERFPHAIASLNTPNSREKIPSGRVRMDSPVACLYRGSQGILAGVE